METIKNTFDFSDFPHVDLMVAGTVLIFLLTFPLLSHSSFAMSTMIQFLMFSITVWDGTPSVDMAVRSIWARPNTWVSGPIPPRSC